MPAEFINETPFKFAALPGRVGFPGHSLTLVAKGTFKLVPGGAATMAEEQAEFAGDVPYEGDESDNGAPQSEADLIAPTKPKTDFVVVGQCHVPGGNPVPACQVSAALGAHVHHLNVFGNRQWLPDGRLLGPEPFTSMPLRYECSYGGLGFPENPVGVGFAPVVGPDGRSLHALPNIEDARTLVARPGAHTFPAGFGALSRTWRFRSSKLGTYNDDYVKMRWPALPVDFDWTHYCAAHPAMQIEPYATGDETLIFSNMHQQHVRFESKLPGLRIRGFLDVPKGDAIALHEVPMHLDTVWVDVQSEALVMVWRGVVAVSSAKYPEVRRVYLVSESLASEPRPVGDHEVLLSRRLVEMALEAEPPDPENSRLAAVAAAMSVGARGFGSTAALPIRPPQQAEATVDPDDEAEDAAFKAQMAELEAAMAAGAAAIPDNLPDAEEADFEIEPEEAPLTPEQRVAAAKQAVEQGQGLTGGDLSGLDFSRFDFRAANLDGALFTNADLTGAKLDGCSCKGATFAQAKLDHASALAADFSEAQLPGCHAQKANFTGGTFVNASFEGADLQHSVFSGANMEGAVFAEANATSADFSEAKLNKSNFAATSATAANFSGAQLVDATFTECKASNARFSDCNAAKIRAAEADFTGSTWQRCQAVEGVFSEAKLDQCNFSGAVLTDANFMAASLVGALFLATDCKGARFSEGNLSSANLAQSNLFEAIFEASNLSGASLRGCNAYGAEFLDAQLGNCDLAGANLKRTKLEQGKGAT